MSKTINQALKELYLSLGGDPSALEDNSTVSDYIKDLESGLKGLAELPAPSSENAGKIAKVVSDGEGGYIWGADTAPSDVFIALIKYDTTDEAYVYYKGSTKKTWQDFIADAEGKSLVILNISTTNDPAFNEVYTGAPPSFIAYPSDPVSILSGDYWTVAGQWTGFKVLFKRDGGAQYGVVATMSISQSQWAQSVSLVINEFATAT